MSIVIFHVVWHAIYFSVHPRHWLHQKVPIIAFQVMKSGIGTVFAFNLSFKLHSLLCGLSLSLSDFAQTKALRRTNMFPGCLQSIGLFDLPLCANKVYFFTCHLIASFVALTAISASVSHALI